MAAIKNVYFSEFERVCDEAKVDSPWTKEEFDEKAEELGLFIAVLWCSTSYELVKKYPNLMCRAHWCLERSIKLSPKFYQ